MKICSTCKLAKDLSSFNKNKKLKDGLCHECKQCKRDYNLKRYSLKQNEIKEKTKLYRLENKDKITSYQKEYRINNSDKLKNLKIKYYSSEDNRNKKKQLDKIYRNNNKETIKINKRKWEIKNYQNNIQYKLSHILRKRLILAINSNFKNGSAVKDLGCTIQQLKKHLESKFKPRHELE